MKSSIRHNPVTRVLSLVLLCAGLLVAVPSVAGAAQAADACTPGSYASSMVLTVNPTTATAGAPVTIAGTGYPPNSTVTLTYTVVTDTTVQTITTVTTNASGAFSYNWTVPAGTTASQLNVTSSACGTTKTTILAITVAKTTTTVAAPAAGTGGAAAGTGGVAAGTTALPTTGSDVLPLVAGGVALLVIGSLVVLSSRKRAQHI